MMLPRKLLLLLILPVLMIGPGIATAADEPDTSTSVPTTTDTTDTSGTDTAPLTLDQAQIDALTEAASDSSDEDQGTFEKASDFVTDNAPWFIIGVIVLAAIIAGVLIMRGRPRKSNGPGTPKASKSTKSMRDAGGVPKDQPAQVPSASELRRRKRAAIQRSREEERLRRKAGVENRKAARRGEPAPPLAAGAAAGVAGVVAAGLDPVEAEKQGARDQAVAAGAFARLGEEQVQPPAEPLPPQAPAGQAVPAPVSPSQTAPAAGVVTPDSIPQEAQYPPAAEPAYAEPVAEPAPEPYYEPAPEFAEPEVAPEAQTGIMHEPSIENPGPDAAVGNAAQAFLAGGAAGAAGGLAAARAARPDEDPAPEEEPLDPVVEPEPGLSPEHAIAADTPLEPVAEAPVEQVEIPEEKIDEDDERLRAKVAEIRATQIPVESTPVAEPAEEPDLTEPAPLGPDTDLSPGLAAVERRLSENSEERDRTLRDAEERLRRVEQRAEDAERRAAFAERLAQLKVEESEREKRLNDVVSGIDRAEQRAREAEERAEAAERAAAAALEKSELRTPAREETPVVPTAPREEPVPVAPEVDAPAAVEPPAPERKGLFGKAPSTASASGPDAINLNHATFEELREAGLSVTQATRILAYRERFGGYSSVEDLEKVPGFPADLIESLRGKLSI